MHVTSPILKIITANQNHFKVMRDNITQKEIRGLPITRHLIC